MLKKKPKSQEGNMRAQTQTQTDLCTGETDGATANREEHRPSRQHTNEHHTRDTTRDHQPEAGTWSPTKPEDALTDPGERLRIARAFSQ